MLKGAVFRSFVARTYVINVIYEISHIRPKLYKLRKTDVLRGYAFVAKHRGENMKHDMNMQN